MLEAQQVISQSEYVKHVRFNKSLKVRMDGKKRIAVITITE
jgi:hypothetical protein